MGLTKYQLTLNSFNVKSKAKHWSLITHTFSVQYNAVVGKNV